MVRTANLSINVHNLIGCKFGRLEVISFVEVNSNRKAVWECKCDCGNHVNVIGSALLSNNTTSCGCYNKEVISLSRGESSLNKIFSVYRNGANRRKIDFDLPRNKFDELVVSKCFYCGRPPSRYFELTAGGGGVLCNGIDRIDNTKGYTEDNCVPCCSECNYAKREMTYEEFKSWAFDLADNLFAKEKLLAKGK